MHVHILGICGTFMAGVAKLASEKGYKVTGQDSNTYPPMSVLLEKMGIDVAAGYDIEALPEGADIIIIGNAMKRGMPIVEHILNERLPFISGPQWLYQEVLRNKRVIAISGTHGKTTTSAMVTWALEQAGFEPSFLVGGLLPNFDCSARLTSSEWFVIEADEYDTAFFDKRSKFVHYYPEILSINNLEFDHADIFTSVRDIVFQFHCLLRILPEKGLLITPKGVELIEDVVSKGLWSKRLYFNDEKAWHAKDLTKDNSQFEIFCEKNKVAEVTWGLIGQHNVENAMVAQMITQHLGISSEDFSLACKSFKPVKRRLEIIAKNEITTLYEDFAHHPTAINLTLQALRNKVAGDEIIVILDFGSYTMRSGHHKASLLSSLKQASETILFNPPFELEDNEQKLFNEETIDGVLSRLYHHQAKKHVVIMSNRGISKLTSYIVEKLALSRVGGL